MTTFTTEQLQEVVKAMAMAGVQVKHDPGSTTLTATPTAGPYHGNYDQLGIFTDPTVRPERFTALVRYRNSVLRSMLPPVRSEIFEERLEVMTGVTAGSGSNPTGWCGTPPTIGQGKVCRQDYVWGRNFFKTELHAVPEIGNIAHRGVIPAQILNQPPTANPIIPDIMFRLTDPRSELQWSLWRAGVEAERIMETVAWQGNSTLSEANTRRGWFDEFDGIDRQVKTGYVDAVTNLVCPAMDSQVKSWNAAISATVSGDNFVQALSDLVWILDERALDMGFDGLTSALFMRKEMFRPIVDNWSCNYSTYRCTTGDAGNPYFNDVRDTNALRLEMLRGQYLLIEGRPVPVVFSEGILRESLSATLFKSDVYYLPLGWQGVPLLHLDYFPMDNSYLQEWRNFTEGDERTVMNGGLYLASKVRTAFCDELQFAAKMRLILETPFLAGRLDDVQFTATAGTRNADPSDTFFHADGGKTFVNWPA